MTQSDFCTVTVLENNSPIIGTASADTSVWFLLEVPRPWAAKALIDNDLPDVVNQTLARWVDSTPKSRAVFIKKNNVPVGSPTLYIAITEDNDQRLIRFDLQSDYSGFAEIDVAAIIAGQSDAGHPVDENLYLVCTNGKRDNCCSKFGLPIIRAFEQASEPNVWQCTHLGGHKYSAVVGTFPSGLYYQIFNPALVAPFKQSIDKGEMPLQGLRGRTAYTGVAQAAEAFLRQQSGNLDIDAYRLISAADTGQSWHVVFQNGVAQHTVELVKTLSEPVLSGCSGKLKPSPQYQLLAIK